MFVLYLITTALTIAFIWTVMSDDNWKMRLISSITVCLIPFAPFLMISAFMLMGWIFDFPVKFKPITNPFKHEFKSKKSKPQSNLPKCEFSKFINSLKVHGHTTSWYKRAWLELQGDIGNKFYQINSILENKDKSPYYPASLLGALELTLIAWCDDTFDAKCTCTGEYIHNISIKPKRSITQSDLQFLDEFIEAIRIPARWIDEQDRKDKLEDERIQRERSNRINKEYSEVIKSMRADLEKIYNTKGENK